MKKLIFLVNNHPALEFDSNYKIVNNFIKRRVDFFFPYALVVFDNLDELILTKNNVIIELSSVNPLFDIELIKGQLDLLKINPDCVIKSTGHIPGSEPERVYYFNSSGKKVQYFNSNKQLVYNSQVNLNKLKRQKHFRYFLAKNKKFHEYRFEDYFKYIESEEGIIDYLKFGEDVDLIIWDKCPYCSSRELDRLKNSTSQPTNGFITNNVSLYNNCNNCGLIFLKGTIEKQELHKVYDDYSQEFALHRITNKIYHNIDDFHMYSKALDYLESKLLLSQNSIVDLGCGGGEFLFYAKNRLGCQNMIGLDYSILKVDQENFNKEGITTIKGDIIDSMNSIKGEVELFTAWEVIEHLYIEDLESLFSKVLEKLTNNGFFCFSTPDYDNEICRLFDFHLAFPIQHISIFKETWLNRYIEEMGFKIVHKFHGNMMLKDEDWSYYCVDTSPTSEGRNIASIITKLLKNHNTRNNFLTILEENDLGSEIIFILQKV